MRRHVCSRNYLKSRARFSANEKCKWPIFFPSALFIRDHVIIVHVIVSAFQCYSNNLSFVVRCFLLLGFLFNDVLFAGWDFIGSCSSCLWPKMIMSSLRLKINAVFLMHPEMRNRVTVVPWRKETLVCAIQSS